MNTQMKSKATIYSRIVLALFVWFISGLSLCITPRLTSAQAEDPATPTPAVNETIWFVLGPEGKGNGDYFDVQLNPGESSRLVAEVGNGSAIPVKVIIYAADVFSGLNGGFTMNGADSAQTGTTRWLDFPTETREFDAGQGMKKAFTVSVPDGTLPGQYITGLAIETADARAIEGGSPLSQKMRLATAVLITVPGPIEPGFEVNDIAVEVGPHGTSVTGTVTNTGNVRVRPEGTIKLNNDKGATVVEVPIQMGSVYAHDRTSFFVTLPAPIPEGTYAATADLRDPDTGISVQLTDVKVTAAKPVAAATLVISSVKVTPSPSSDNLVFIQVSVTVTNTGTLANGGVLTLRVIRDGKVVDEHSLASSLTMAVGETVVEQPYIPADGLWPAGSYTFEVDLATTDTSSGASTFVGTYKVPEAIVID